MRRNKRTSEFVGTFGLVLASTGVIIAEQVLADLQVQLPPEVVEAGLECGKALQLETVVDELLQEMLESDL